MTQADCLRTDSVDVPSPDCDRAGLEAITLLEESTTRTYAVGGCVSCSEGIGCDES